MPLKFFALLTLAAAAARSTPMYTVTQIGGLRDQGNALSQNGTVGGFNLNNPSQGFIATTSSFNYIGRVSGFDTIVYGVNDSGVAAASYNNSTRAAYWDGTAWVDLHAPLGSLPYASQARSINNAGQIVGIASNDGQVFVRDPSGTISYITGMRRPMEINSSGKIAGTAFDRPAWADPSGTLNYITGLIGSRGRANAISDAGHVAGWHGNSFFVSAFIYTPGSGYVDVPGLVPNQLLDLQGVNSSGDAVGASNGRAALVTGGVTLDLNTLIFPVPNLFLQSALRINDAGQILAIGRFTLAPSTDTYTFLLTPDTGSNAVPEPSSYALLGAGLTALGWARRRQSVGGRV